MNAFWQQIIIWWNQSTLLQQMVGGIFLFAFVVQLFYYCVLFTRLFKRQRQVNKQKYKFSDAQPPVSVIVCAKNENDNLIEFLPKLLEQDYPDFEVIVVNDGSTDDTNDTLTCLKNQYPKLRSTFVPVSAKFINSKKIALILGIKAANNETLVFTDADCYPASNQWLAQIMQSYTPGTRMVLGYGRYQSFRSPLNYLICYNTLFIAIQYLNYALLGKAYMGVGRNISYQKSLFLASSQFSNHLNLQSGDDDLFVNEVSKQAHANIAFGPTCSTISIPKMTFADWKLQKIRHLSTGPYYKTSTKLLIGTETASRFFFYLGLILLFCMPNPLCKITAALALIIRTVVQYIIINRSAHLLGERFFRFGIILLDIFLPLTDLVFYVSNAFRHPGRLRWK